MRVLYFLLLTAAGVVSDDGCQTPAVTWFYLHAQAKYIWDSGEYLEFQSCLRPREVAGTNVVNGAGELLRMSQRWLRGRRCRERGGVFGDEVAGLSPLSCTLSLSLSLSFFFFLVFFCDVAAAVVVLSFSSQD